jgi:hypothetical protein
MKLLSAILFCLCCTGIAKADMITLNPTDQNGINQALQNGGTVYLNAGVYEITGTVNIHSDTVLTGSSDAIIKVSPSSSQWFTGQTGIISCSESIKNVEISGFRIDGNCENLPASYASTPGHSHDAGRLIILGGYSNDLGSNISIHDMKLYDAFSDGAYIKYSKNVNCYNNEVSNCQHEGFYYSVVLDSTIHDNKVAAITSDGIRYDNCVNCKCYDNVLFSYSGSNNNGAYENGDNGLQIGDSGVSKGYDARNKPTTTTNIEVYGNTFAANGLQAILLDSVALESSANVFIHDNKFIGKAELETSGISFEISDSNPSTIERSEKVFTSIFDILNVNFQDSGITNQDDSKIVYSVQKNNVGNIAGGVKIVGFRNEVIIDNNTYMQDNNSTIVKSEAIMNPTLDFWNQGVDKIEKNVSIRIENGTAAAILTVKMRYYTESMFKGKLKKSYYTSTATFNDTAKAPDVYPAPQNISGVINVYPTYFEVFVPSNSLVKIRYGYDSNYTDHSFISNSRFEQKQMRETVKFFNIS